MKKRKVMKRRGEDFLADVESIVIKLESGKTQTFSMALELPRLPDDPEALGKEAEATTGRLAFWLYQAERAKSEAKRREEQSDKAWAREYHTQRTHIQQGLVDSVEIPTENNIKHRILLDECLETEKERARQAWRRYGALRSLTVALEHRSHLIRLLIKRQTDSRVHG